MQDVTEEEQKAWIDRGDNRIGVNCCGKACIILPDERELKCEICGFTISIEKVLRVHGLAQIYNLVSETYIDTAWD